MNEEEKTDEEKTLVDLKREWKADGLVFSGFGCEEPPEPWNYDLDDYDVTYGAGPWPFYKTYGIKREPANIRLAPDTAYQAWNTMYAMAYFYNGQIDFDFNVHARKQGMGTLSYPCLAVFDADLQHCDLKAPPKCRHNAWRYVAKFRAFMVFHLHRRDAGKRKILTAHEKYVKGLY